MSFYLVDFWDKRDQTLNKHYVFSENIDRAKIRFESEEPFLEVRSWVPVSENDLPELVIVIQK